MERALEELAELVGDVLAQRWLSRSRPSATLPNEQQNGIAHGGKPQDVLPRGLYSIDQRARDAGDDRV